MIALNDDSIYVGQIKQLLHTFNLPLCQIGRKNPQPYYHFIDNNDIYYWDENLDEKWVSKYLYGHDYLNITSTMPVQNMIYDRSTHRYLGKYLKFLRDYNNVNLMSMYNCFDSETITYSRKLQISKDRSINFDKNDSAFITYQIPVSYGIDLTLYLQSIQTFEVCMFFAPYSKTVVEDDEARNVLAAATYRKLRSNTVMCYNPIDLASHFIEKLSENTQEDPIKIEAKQTKYRNMLKKYYNELYLLVKLPKSTRYSMIVLEGKYQIKNDKETKYLRYQPCVDPNDSSIVDNTVLVNSSINAIGRYPKDTILKQVVNIDGRREVQYYYAYLADSGFEIASQLLSYENLTGNYLLADRLIEYLTFNAIDPLSISSEIKRLQLALDNTREDYSSSQIFYTSTANSSTQQFCVLKDGTHEVIDFYVPTELSINTYKPKNRQYGIWNYLDEQDLKSIEAYTKLNLDYDVLGYLDKDIEDVLRGDLDDAKF